MTDFTDPRLKRLLFQSTHRGMKEMDVILGGFAERHLSVLGDDQLGRFEAVLQESDSDLFDWISGKRETPGHLDHDVMVMIRLYEGSL